MSKRICFLVYEDWEEALLECDDKTFRELITSIFSYGFRKEETELSPLAKMMMKLIKPALDRDWEKYEERANNNRINGLKGGRKKKNPVGNESEDENPKNPVGFKKPSGLSENQKNPLAPIKDKQDNIKDNIDIPSSLRSEDSSHGNADGTPPKSFRQKVILYFNEKMSGKAIKPISAITDGSKRAESLKARMREHGNEAIFQVIEKASDSKFLNGYNQRGFIATFDWLIRPNNFIKVLEGNYDNRDNFYEDSRRNNSAEQRLEEVASIMARLASEDDARQ